MGLPSEAFAQAGRRAVVRATRCEAVDPVVWGGLPELPT